MSDTTTGKHTAGPWEADAGEGFSIWRVCAAAGTIAHVIGDSAETDANAALIAAAPDLLAALYVAARCPGVFTTDQETGETYWKTIADAIGKATGDAA